MKPGDRIACTLVLDARAMAAAVLLALPLTLPLVSGQNDKGPERRERQERSGEAGEESAAGNDHRSPVRR